MDQSVGMVTGGVIGLVLVAIVGLAIGAVAKLLMPGRDPGGWFVTMTLGIAGSWVGQMLFGSMGLGNIGIVGAIIGAMLLLGGYRLLKRG
ncbi:MAG TPA: GlsB/YeaQ/YmgE family stress response membrane protein [Vicinamibacterales bacterium]|nr:GlsB/YeaQ/YmgE family stress response membrane protein [Vicinamibacterales bacterium]